MAVPGTSRPIFRPSSDFADLYAVALKGLTWFHRWVGIILCLMFATWFATGAVMVFVAFPSLPEDVRVARSDVIDPAQVRVAPPLVAARMGTTDGLRLTERAGAPVYVGKLKGRFLAVSAVSGEPLSPVTADQAKAIAARFGRAPAAAVSGPLDYDQWVVHQQFDPWRPLYRVRLADNARTELYVSAATGEVVQRTEGLERAANWVGSVIHWLYFVPLRKSFAAWDWTVWLLSLVGLASVTAGVWLGVTRTTKKMRSRRPALSPFRGLLRWHHVIGLAAGAFVLFWIVSGWLSMDHGRLFSEGEATAAAAQAYRDGSASGRVREITGADIQAIATGASRVEFAKVGGCQIAAAAGPTGSHVLSDCPAGRTVTAKIPQSLIRSAIAAAWPAERLESLTAVRADSPYAKAETLAEGVLEAKLGGPHTLRVFIDPVSGQIQVVMDRSRETYAWVYYMLHTYNYPGLSDRPVLRIAILLTPLTLGFVFSITGVLVGIRRLRGFQPAPSASKSKAGAPT